MRSASVLRLLVVAAALGLSVFAYMAWHAVTLEAATPQKALQEITAARAALGAGAPMLRLDASGRVVRVASPLVVDGIVPSQLRVLAYQASDQRVVRVDVPLWFLILKGPGIHWVLRGVQIDLEQLGVTAADLRDHRPGLVLDEVRANGDRLLVWTE